MANPCALSKHVATIEQAGWQRDRVVLGCVPKFAQPAPQMAPPDLRGIQLPAGWQTMRSFYLTSGNTEYIPNLPPQLETLVISKNKLQELPALPRTLRKLDVDNNEISELPALPPSLRVLDIRRNRLVSVPSPLPVNLQVFHVTRNFVRELPSFEGTSVTNVGLGYNRLTSLPAFPITLQTLGCPFNEITSITNLPVRVHLLNCANNPLETLKIDNLIFLHLLVATNCGLKRIPLLPLPNGEADDDDNDNDNNNDNENADDFNMPPRIILDNNPLEPAFARIYENYQNNDNYRVFRRQVLREHRRIIQAQKDTLGAVIQTLKPAVVEERLPANAEERRAAEVRRQVFANHGPGNLIASFITGKPGTLEMQRLALVENQERLGAVAPGTAERMRERIANVAVAEPEEGNAKGKLMQERAKLYVQRSNLAEAKERYQERMAALLAEKRLSEKRERLLNPLTELQILLIDAIEGAEILLNEFYTGLKQQKHLLKIAPQLEDELAEGLGTLYKTGDCSFVLEKVISRTVKNKYLRNLAQLKMKLVLLRLFNEQISTLIGFISRPDEDLDEWYKDVRQMIKSPEGTYMEFVQLAWELAEKLFPVYRNDDEIEKLKSDEKIKELCQEVAQKLMAFRRKQNTNENNVTKQKNVEDVSEEEREALSRLAEIHNHFAQVVENDEEESEAMRVAMAEAEDDEEERQRLEALRDEELAALANANNNNNDEINENDRVNIIQRGFPNALAPLPHPENEAEARDVAEQLEQGGVEAQRALRQARELVIMRRELQDGGRRNRTPRKRKGTRQSRKH